MSTSRLLILGFAFVFAACGSVSKNTDAGRRGDADSSLPDGGGDGAGSGGGGGASTGGASTGGATGSTGGAGVGTGGMAIGTGGASANTGGAGGSNGGAIGSGGASAGGAIGSTGGASTGGATGTGGAGTGGAGTGGAGTGGAGTGGAGTGGAGTGGAGTGGAGGSQTVMSATWSTTAVSVQGQTAAQFTYACPAGGVAGSLWGTDNYTADSSICTAAVHAGIITTVTGGPVTIQIIPGFPSYAGSLRNGVTSASWTSFGYSFRFPAQTTWVSKATAFRGMLNVNFAFQCPANGTAATIWGSDIYTDDSPVCTAAVHAGLITLAAGGSVAISMVAGQSAYTASTRNGITSTAYGAWSGSFLFPH